MSSFIKQFVKTKMKQLSADELLHYAHEYNFPFPENKQMPSLPIYKHIRLILSAPGAAKCFESLPA